MKEIIGNYIKYVKKNMQDYLKDILVSKYDSEMINEYIKTYINVRYYNIYSEDIKKARPLYLKIRDEISKKTEILMKSEKKYDINVLKTVEDIFYYILYWDEVRNVENSKNIQTIQKTIEKVDEIRNQNLNIKPKEDFQKNLYEKIKSNTITKEVYRERFETSTFNIELQKIENKKNLYFINLKYNINMPPEYTEETVEEVFNKGIIAEEKLKIEYRLITTIILEDIIKGEFNDIYISNLPNTIWKKSKKMDSFLSLINNEITQDKLYLNIQYSEFEKNKEKILSYISDGFKFCITLDNKFTNIEELRKMQMINYIFVDKNVDLYKEIKKNINNFSNIILI